MPEFLYDNEKLIQYLDGEMSSLEKEVFEKQLSTDKALQQQLESLKAATELVKYYGTAQQVASIHNNLATEKRVTKTRKAKVFSFKKIVRYSTAVAASILFVFLALQGYRFYQLSPEKLYTEAYKSYPSQTTRSSAVSETAIEKMYRQQNFTGVLNELKNKKKLNDKEYFLAALSYLKVNDAFQAVGLLKKLADTTESELKQDAEYYLALAYLKNKDYDYSIQVMKQIHNDPNHAYYRQFSPKFIRRVQMLKWR